MNTKNILFQSKSTGKRTFTAFRNKPRPDRFIWIVKKDAQACPMFDFRKAKEFWYPELDGIIVHADKKMKRYKTSEEAYTVACEIKEALTIEYSNK